MEAVRVRETLSSSGVPVIEMRLAGRLATTITVAFPAGARHERTDEVGVAHLLEHMAFKGTEANPTSRELNRAAGHLGTDLEARVTNDFVEFWSELRAEATMPAFDLLTDLVGRPLLEQSGLESERSVILQELAEAREDPASRADDLLLAALFDGHRLAKNTAGEESDVRQLSHERLLAFRERQWSPQGGVVVIAGNLEHLDRDKLADYLQRIPPRPLPETRPPTPPFVPRVKTEEFDGDVVHLRLVYSIPGVDLKRRRDRAITEVYSQLIGGPMGSRLFDELREQRALCYWVSGYVWGYEDAAFLSVRCSVGAGDLAEIYERIQTILADLHANGPTEEETARARAYATSAVALDFESSSSLTDHAVELIMGYDDHDIDPILHLQATDSVTHNDLIELAARVNLDIGPCIGCVGPATTDIFQ
jgi:predicted Zn-dependent peptidase